MNPPLQSNSILDTINSDCVKTAPPPAKTVFATDLRVAYHQIENYRSLCGRPVRRWWQFFTDIIPEHTPKGRRRKNPLVLCGKCKKVLIEKGLSP